MTGPATGPMLPLFGGCTTGFKWKLDDRIRLVEMYEQYARLVVIDNYGDGQRHKKGF